MRLLKPSGSLERTYGAIRLHLDDLEQVLALLRQADLTVTTSDPLYEYDGLAEVAEKRGPHPRTIRIDARTRDGSSQIALAIDGSRATLRSDRPSDLGTLPHDLGKLLESHDSPFLRLLHPLAWGAAGCVAYFLQASGWQIRTRDGQDVFWLLPVTCLVITLVSVASRKAFAGVWLKRRHEGGFLRRNRDALWLLAIGALLGAVATAIVGALWR